MIFNLNVYEFLAFPKSQILFDKISIYITTPNTNPFLHVRVPYAGSTICFWIIVTF